MQLARDRDAEHILGSAPFPILILHVIPRAGEQKEPDFRRNPITFSLVESAALYHRGKTFLDFGLRQQRLTPNKVISGVPDRNFTSLKLPKLQDKAGMPCLPSW
jgi:hypothetical protein